MSTDRRGVPPSTNEAHDDDAGIGMMSVVVMLVLLAVLVVGIFWGLPLWFGSQMIEVTIRN